MVQVVISNKAPVKGATTGQKTFSEMIDSYIKAVSKPEVAKKTSFKSIEADVSKMKHYVVKSGEYTLYLVDVPITLKDGKASTKTLIKRAWNPNTETGAYLKSFRAYTVEA